MASLLCLLLDTVVFDSAVLTTVIFVICSVANLAPNPEADLGKAVYGAAQPLHP